MSLHQDRTTKTPDSSPSASIVQHHNQASSTQLSHPIVNQNTQPVPNYTNPTIIYTQRRNMFRSALRPLTSAATAATATRRVAVAATAARPLPRVSQFHSTARAFVKAGDPLPDTDALMENSPGQRVNLAEEAKKYNNMLLIGVPAAFSPACSATHVPGYASHPRLGEFELVGVVSVNDVFV